MSSGIKPSDWFIQVFTTQSYACLVGSTIHCIQWGLLPWKCAQVCNFNFTFDHSKFFTTIAASINLFNTGNVLGAAKNIAGMDPGHK